jgi:hypothetical protein
MTTSPLESLPKGQQVIRIYQETRHVLSSGLLYVAKETTPSTQHPETEEIEESLAALSAQEIGALIIEEAATYSSRTMALRLNVLASRYMALQDEAATTLLEAGPATVTRREHAALYTLADFTGEEPETIAGPVTGVAEDETYASLGRFKLMTEEMRLCTVSPLDFRGLPQVDIHIEA